jgi:hypothetical protein
MRIDYWRTTTSAHNRLIVNWIRERVALITGRYRAQTRQILISTDSRSFERARAGDQCPSVLRHCTGSKNLASARTTMMRM